MRSDVDCEDDFARSLVSIVWNPRVLVPRLVSQASIQYSGQHQRVRGVHDPQRILVARNRGMLWNRVYGFESMAGETDCMGCVSRHGNSPGGIGRNVPDARR